MFNVKIPPFVAEQKENLAIKKVTDIEDKECKEFIQDIINQCFIDTATWGLKYWEELYGIPTDISKPIEFRRTVVKAKKRGAATTTVSNLKNVCESFSNGAVLVIEDETGNFELTIKFVGNVGIPPNLQDLKDAVEENKPCYLQINYDFKYNTVKDLRELGLTVKQLADMNIKVKDLIETNLLELKFQITQKGSR